MKATARSKLNSEGMKNKNERVILLGLEIDVVGAVAIFANAGLDFNAVFAALDEVLLIRIETKGEWE